MFEKKSQALLHRKHFYRRLARSFAAGMALVVFSLGIGMIGYSYFEQMSPIDSFLNAAMIMSGMGPVGTLKSDGGKIFAGIYALYCGLALITAAAVILAPVVPRFFHRFHMEDEPKGS